MGMNDLTKIPCGIVKLDVPTDIICNGFSIKETIKEVLSKYNTVYNIDLREYAIDEIAEEIKEAFAVKLRGKQG